MSSIRVGRRKRQQVRVGAPDRALTANAGLAAVTELCDRLGVAEELDAAVGPIKQRDRGFGAGELLTGIAAAQLAGEDFLTGLDRQRADAAGQQVTPVPGLASTTAAGLARRFTPAQWQAVEPALAAVTGRMLSLLPASGSRRWPKARSPSTWTPPTWRSTGPRSAAWPITIRASVGLPHVAAWAETEAVLAADLGDGTDDPRATAPDLLRRALACPAAAGTGFGAGGHARLRGVLRRAARPRRARAHIGFAIGAADRAAVAAAGRHRRRRLARRHRDGRAQVAVAEYCPDWCREHPAADPPGAPGPAQVSADPRSRRRRTLHPDQRALPIPELAGAGRSTPTPSS